jgi:hypothetical protein
MTVLALFLLVMSVSHYLTPPEINKEDFFGAKEPGNLHHRTLSLLGIIASKWFLKSSSDLAKKLHEPIARKKFPVRLEVLANRNIFLNIVK